MQGIKTWKEYQQHQRWFVFFSMLSVLVSARLFYYGGWPGGILFAGAAVLFAVMGVFPRTPEGYPMARRWIIGLTLALCGLGVLLGQIA